MASCLLCFETRHQQTIACYKCKGMFHLPCVSESVNEWLDSGKRKSTWKCVNCFVPSTENPVLCNCDMASKCEIIRTLQEDLDKAKARIRLLEEEVKSRASSFSPPAEMKDLRKEKTAVPNQWQTVQTKNKYGRRSFSDVVKYKPTPTANSFEALQVPSDSTEDPPLDEQQPKSNQVVRRKKKVIFVTDSHGKQCGLQLQKELGTDFDALVVTHPGAPFRHVAKSAAVLSKSLQEGDHVAVLAGTNDLTAPHHPTPNLDLSPLGSVSVSTNVYIVHVPFRYDDTRFNKSISKLNSKIDSSAVKNNFKTISLNNMNYRHHTKHGLHLNQTGKETLCKLLARKIKSSQSMPKQLNVPSTSEPSSTLPTSPPSHEPNESLSTPTCHSSSKPTNFL